MATDTRAGQELAGYRIEAEIGRGGMGVVYRAHDPELSRQVALKVIAPELASDPAFKERFLSEMKVAAALEHPHVCPVYRAGESQGELFLVLRLLEGEDLGQKVAREGPLEPSSAAELVSQLASALDYAHARSLLHRDVKADNVLLDAEGNAYLTDFGLAGAIWQAEEDSLFAGTLAYLAPERCQGEAALAASDQYALACLATTLLTGQPPFTCEHEAALLYAHLREDPPSLAEHGLARADPVLQQALAKDPAERYESCSAFASELAAALARPERVGGEAWPEALPRPATRLVGRQKELAAVEALLRDPSTRLVTLTGPGGTGKTRLALHAAAEAADAFQDGVHWVSLAPLRDPAYALSAIAQALDIHEQPPAPLRDTLADALAGRKLLLCLDNAEHLLPEIADDIAHLRDIPSGPTLLCTSRERLDLQAERLYPVPSLQETEAAELFSDRASYLDPAHDPADPAIAELCQRLDSLPLALELAAARSDLYSPSELLHALEGRLELLRGARDHDPRHRTLAATIAWSYDLLSDAEQAAFRALSVFAGGCSAEAALEVALADPALLASLVTKSLLRTRESFSGRRFVMLETVRQYAAAKLEEAGEEEGARERHATLTVALVEKAAEGLKGSDQEGWLGAIDTERGNVSATLAWLDRCRDGDRLLAVADRLRRYLHIRGAWSESERWYYRVLSLTVGQRTGTRANALLGAAGGRFYCGDYEGAIGLQGEGVEIWRELGDPASLARALSDFGVSLMHLGRSREASRAFEEAVAQAERGGDPYRAALALGNAVNMRIYLGDYSEALSLGEDVVARVTELGAPDLLAWSLSTLAMAQTLSGRPDQAARGVIQSITISRQLGDVHLLASALVVAAAISAKFALELAARLLGAMESAFRQWDYVLQPFDAGVIDETGDVARASLGSERYEDLVSSGRALTVDETVELALEVLGMVQDTSGT